MIMAEMTETNKVKVSWDVTHLDVLRSGISQVNCGTMVTHIEGYSHGMDDHSP